MQGKSILLIIGGGIAAYKCLDFIRRAKERGAKVRCILTAAAQEFITPLSAAVLSEEPAFTELFDLKNETGIGHIRLSREADLIVVAPATADLLAKMAQGLAGDLATAVLLARDKPVLAAPAMNWRMWENPATRRNLAQLKADGVHFVGPNEGAMACGEFGPGPHGRGGRNLGRRRRASGRRGRQAAAGPPCAGHGRADLRAHRSGALHRQPLQRQAGLRHRRGRGPAGRARDTGLGAEARWPSCRRAAVHVETALEMLAAVEAALPADIAIFGAAVADWRPAKARPGKIKKGDGPPTLIWSRTPISSRRCRSGLRSGPGW